MKKYLLIVLLPVLHQNVRAQHKKLPDYTLKPYTAPISWEMVKSAGSQQYTEIILGHPYSKLIDTVNRITVSYDHNGHITRKEDRYYPEPEATEQSSYKIRSSVPRVSLSRTINSYDRQGNLLEHQEATVYPANSYMQVLLALTERHEKQQRRQYAPEEEDIRFQDSLLQHGLPEIVLPEKEQRYSYNKEGNRVTQFDPNNQHLTRYHYSYYPDGNVRISTAISRTGKSGSYQVTQLLFTYTTGDKPATITTYTGTDSNRLGKQSGI